ncbi:hypothetical protein FGO68_gene11553 [Halteria grandinella]|uniref:Cadherin domain-containing protein n=1 Tax=Halteria grandinella TaxID=5974 RepID=A0A8J8P775_HALGN|nr:hypothetical protein FGO68_gene11553 [Halteria grandinella]
MSNTPQQSCYQIASTIFQTYSISSTSGFVQVSVYTYSTYITLYQSSSTFKDLQTTSLTSIQSWCPNKAGALSFDASVSNTFKVNYGYSEISLTPLSLFCGSPFPVITYSFYNPSAVPSGMSIIGPLIKITDSLHHGKYIVRVNANAPPQSASYDIQVVVNMYPSFSQSLSKFVVQLDRTATYSLPQIVDPEGHTFTISIQLISVTTQIPTHTCVSLATAIGDTQIIAYDSTLRKFTITTNAMTPITWACDFKYEIVLTDSQGATSPILPLTLSIIQGHLPPYWVYDPPKTVIMHIGENINFNLPESEDPNGDTISLIQITKPSFATLTPPFNYTLSPQTNEHIGFFQITGNLSDGTSQFLPFEINITVFNFAPNFTKALKNQTQEINEFIEYQLPTISDYESPYTDPISYSICFVQENQYCDQNYPGFVTFVKEQGLFQFKGVESDVGNYTFRITLVDSLGNFSVNYLMINVTKPKSYRTVQNQGPPEFQSPIQAKLTIEEGKSEQIKFPQIKDPDNDLYDCSVNLGSAVTFSTYKNLALTISPLSSHVSSSSYTIQIILTDKNKYTLKNKKYQLKITVTAKQVNQTTTERTQSNSNYYIDDNQMVVGSKPSSSQNQAIQKENVTMRLKLVDITNTGKAKIKVYSRSSSKIMQFISNTTFRIQLSSGGEIVENVLYTIENGNYSNILVLQLNFRNPQTISIAQDYDKLLISTIRKISIVESSFIEIFPIGVNMEGFIPPQISESAAQKQELIKKSGDYASYALVSSNLLLNIFLSGILAYLFGLLNDISQLTMLSLININIPGQVSLITTIIMNLIYMDLLQTDLWINNIIDLDSEDDDAICPSFKLAGYSSKLTIKNLGSTFVFIFILAAYQMGLLLTKIFTIFFTIEKVMNVFQKAKASLYWNMLIRFIIQQYQAIMISSLVCVFHNLNGFHLSYGEYLEKTATVGQKISAYIGIALLAGSLIAPIAMAWVINKHQREGTLMSTRFKENYGTLVDGLKEGAHWIIPYWNVIILFRWAIQISIFVLLKEASAVQIIINLVISQMFTILVVYLRPFQNQSSCEAWVNIDENNFKIFNEIIVTYYLIFMLLLTDIASDNEQRLFIGMVELAIIGLCVFSNILKAGIVGINELKRRKAVKRRKELQQHKLRFHPCPILIYHKSI